MIIFPVSFSNETTWDWLETNNPSYSYINTDFIAFLPLYLVSSSIKSYETNLRLYETKSSFSLQSPCWILFIINCTSYFFDFSIISEYRCSWYIPAKPLLAKPIKTDFRKSYCIFSVPYQIMFSAHWIHIKPPYPKIN